MLLISEVFHGKEAPVEVDTADFLSVMPMRHLELFPFASPPQMKDPS